jgi:uridine kinase
MNRAALLDEIALARAAERDMNLTGTAEAVEERYRRRYIPGQQLYFARCHPEANADMIIDNRQPAQPEITVCRIQVAQKA